MSASDPTLGEFGFAGDDRVVPFQIDELDLRGRIVQMGPILDGILNRHDYPEPVGRLLAEVIVLAALLGTSLKFEGKFILQTQTDGPVDMMVADFATPDAIRAYARFDEERLAQAIEVGADAPEQLLGKGILAMTIDQGAHTQRYQGIVQLDGSNLEEIAKAYFRQSEQIPTDMRIAVGKQVVAAGGRGTEHWRAGGIIAQFLPDAPERMRLPDLPGGDGDNDRDALTDPTDDAWRETEALLATIEPTELWDPMVGAERLLFRLFHNHGTKVFEGTEVRDKCSCNRQKIGVILEGFTSEEIAESTEDGKIRVTCEFCSTAYTFDPSEFA